MLNEEVVRSINNLVNEIEEKATHIGLLGLLSDLTDEQRKHSITKAYDKIMDNKKMINGLLKSI